MIEVKMTLAEWREMLGSVPTEQIKSDSVKRHDTLKDNLDTCRTSLNIAFEQRDNAVALCENLSSKLHDIRKLVNTSPIYSQREQHDKFEEIKKLVNNA